MGRAMAAPPAVPRGAAGAVPSSTTVAVALPLPERRTHFGGEEGGVDKEAAEDEPGGGAGGGGCHVYATLPLRPSGLPFDLQVRVRAHIGVGMLRGTGHEGIQRARHEVTWVWCCWCCW